MTLFSVIQHRAAACAAVACTLLVAGHPDAVLSADVPKDWRVFETDQRTQEYRNKLREGTFDATSRGFLTDVALPQLALPANRDSIDRVRRRIRESLVADPSLPTVVEFMTALARDEAAPLAVRVNAMLLLGELTGRDKRPWPAAAAPLLAALGDAAVPMAVRVAAAAGLDQHVAVSGKELAPTAGPVLVTVAKSDPVGGDPVAVNWLAGRALAMLTAMGPDAPADVAAVATVILADESRPLDVRVRAAAALGGTAAQGRGIDTATSLRGIRDLAVTVVKEERERARRAGATAPTGSPGAAGYGDPSMVASPMMAPPGFVDPSLAGGAAGYAPPGMPLGSFPGSPSMGPSGMPVAGALPALEGLRLAFRRAAWRLSMLANALEKDGATAGLVVVAGPLQDNARQMATMLRDAATAIDAAPTPLSIDKAFKSLGGVDPAAGGAANAPPADAPVSTPAGPTPPGVGASAASAPPGGANLPAPAAPAPSPGPQPAAANPFAQ